MALDPWQERLQIRNEMLSTIAVEEIQEELELTSKIERRDYSVEPLPCGRFGPFAARLLLNQAARSPFLKAYLAGAEHAIGPDTPLAQLPAVPVAAFREGPLMPPRLSVVATFQTSGTTSNTTGRHEFFDLSLYDSAAPLVFKRHVLGSNANEKVWRFVNLLPAPDLAPHSSLVHMMARVAAVFNPMPASWLAEPGPVIPASAVDRLDDAVKSAAENNNTPLILAGPAFAFVQLLAHVAISPEMPQTWYPRWSLPPGSRIMETGGFKGRTREIQRDQFHQMLSVVFAVPPPQIINEYGMTELTSQFYDETITTGANSEWKMSPPWLRAWPVQPLTGQPCPPQEPGLLRIADLLNLDSAAIIQTEDLAVADDRGRFRLLGRAQSALPRGCSLPYERPAP